MGTNEQDNKILLEKFDLDDNEMIIAKKLINKYAEKIKRLVEYNQIKLEMKVHQKNKNKHFEIKGRVDFKKGKAMSEKQDPNPFVAIDGVMEKLVSEINHSIKKA
jgi:ribosome-associated translation inhibitor RaiA